MAVNKFFKGLPLVFILFCIAFSLPALAQDQSPSISDFQPSHKTLKLHKAKWEWLFHPHVVNYAEMKYSKPFFRPADHLNGGRVAIITGTSLAIFTGAIGLLWQYWYKGFPRSGFHFYNDWPEWQQMDKTGHFFSSAFISKYSIGMYRWTGMKEYQAILAGGMTGTFLMMSIEIMDGLSKQWGFSWGDMEANFAGSVLVMAQEFAWKEQRINIKISGSPVGYPPDLKPRAEALFGNTAFELFLKDYNAITMWASCSIGSFVKNGRVPKWLCVSVGYGAEGMFGARSNVWNTNSLSNEYATGNGTVVNRSDIKRYRQFYLSMDIDLTKIKTKIPALKTLFNIINLIKVPFPTLEFNNNSSHRVIFHPLFF